MCIRDRDKHGEWIKADYIRPRSKFAYRLKLDASKIKKSKHTESFVIVQEGNKHLTGSEVTINLNVTN